MTDLGSAVRLALTRATICFLSRPSRSLRASVVTRYAARLDDHPSGAADEDDLEPTIDDRARGQFRQRRRGRPLGRVGRRRHAGRGSHARRRRLAGRRRPVRRRPRHPDADGPRRGLDVRRSPLANPFDGRRRPGDSRRLRGAAGTPAPVRCAVGRRGVARRAVGLRRIGLGRWRTRGVRQRHRVEAHRQGARERPDVANRGRSIDRVGPFERRSARRRGRFAGGSCRWLRGPDEAVGRVILGLGVRGGRWVVLLGRGVRRRDACAARTGWIGRRRARRDAGRLDEVRRHERLDRSAAQREFSRGCGGRRIARSRTGSGSDPWPRTGPGRTARPARGSRLAGQADPTRHRRPGAGATSVASAEFPMPRFSAELLNRSPDRGVGAPLAGSRPSWTGPATRLRLEESSAWLARRNLAPSASFPERRRAPASGSPGRGSPRPRPARSGRPGGLLDEGVGQARGGTVPGLEVVEVGEVDLPVLVGQLVAEGDPQRFEPPPGLVIGADAVGADEEEDVGDDRLAVGGVAPLDPDRLAGHGRDERVRWPGRTRWTARAGRSRSLAAGGSPCRWRTR